MGRDGPGLLLRDLSRDDDQIDAVLAIIAKVSPDILLLTDFDYDHDGLALSLFAARSGYPHAFARRPNSGMMTDVDLDQNGRLGDARDAQGYGRFSGDSGMAILSRWPVDDADVRDFSDLLWRDMPDAELPLMSDGTAWPDSVLDVQRLSTTGHWIVPVRHPDGAINVLAFSATPPVFDGPEDRNGLRNRDELRLWSHVLDGIYGPPPVDFVIAGNANLDPVDGNGLTGAMAAFLGDPRLIDPKPASIGGALAADADQRGDPALDTADWPDGAPGNLRVSYVLPASTYRVMDAGVFWPAPDADDAALLGDDFGPHRMVWVDIAR